MPVVPALPQSPTAPRRAHRDSAVSVASVVEDAAKVESSASVVATEAQGEAQAEDMPEAAPVPAAPKPKPSSWASLLRPAQSQGATVSNVESGSNANGGPTARGEVLSDVLHDMSATIDVPSKVSFLQPRGLVNTGNMCYMNSVRLISNTYPRVLG
jgi:ubiquitin carboxyl-terminal hydrolase 10